MSMSIKDLGERLYFAAVPLFLIFSTLLVLWLTLFNDSERSRGVNLPRFDYKPPANETVQSDVVIHSDPVKPQRDIFLINRGSKKEEQPLEMHEVALGLVIVKGNKRFCLTNGVLFEKGQGGLGFIVHRIEANGVWYRIGDRDIFLQTGEKVNVDGDGNVRE